MSQLRYFHPYQRLYIYIYNNCDCPYKLVTIKLCHSCFLRHSQPSTGHMSYRLWSATIAKYHLLIPTHIIHHRVRNERSGLDRNGLCTILKINKSLFFSPRKKCFINEPRKNTQHAWYNGSLRATQLKIADTNRNIKRLVYCRYRK